MKGDFFDNNFLDTYYTSRYGENVSSNCTTSYNTNSNTDYGDFPEWNVIAHRFTLACIKEILCELGVETLVTKCESPGMISLTHEKSDGSWSVIMIEVGEANSEIERDICSWVLSW